MYFCRVIDENVVWNRHMDQILKFTEASDSNVPSINTQNTGMTESPVITTKVPNQICERYYLSTRLSLKPPDSLNLWGDVVMY